MKFSGLTMHNKRVLLRADLNVLLKNGTITNDFRLKAIVPTVQNILEQGGLITILTHIGRPKKVDLLYSTSHLIPWFKSHGISVAFAKNFDEAHHHIKEKRSVILFENLRFFDGEQSNVTNKRETFCKKLAQLGDVFVNDAFGVLHRNDASITLLPLLFTNKTKALGPLVCHELEAINTLRLPKNGPLVCIVGGGKVASKLPACAQLSLVAQHVIIGPALSFTCMKAQGLSVGKSLVDTSQIANAKKILENIRTSPVQLYLPEDYQVTNKAFPGETLYTVLANEFPAHATGVTIGPKSIKKIQHIMSTAGSIFYTGLIGSTQTDDALSGTYHLFTTMVKSNAITMIAGGDSVAAAQLLALNKNISHLSTGGGSALIYLAHGTLPGLIPFDN